jgi:predicted O-linked N-acetylglucosamine transferase (SPINDLY family)
VRGDLERAAGSLDQALRLRPGYPEALHQQGLVFVQQGRWTEAAARIRDALRLQPNDVEIQTNLAAVLPRLGKCAEAVALLQAVLRARPEHARAQSALRQILAQQPAASASRPTPATAEANDKGLTYLHQGKLVEAAGRFRQALRLQADFPDAHYNLGYTLFCQGKLDEAVACYQQAVRLRPDFAEAHNNLGMALRAQKRAREAEASCRQAARLRPESPEVHVNLGMALLELERPDEALESLQRALQLRPGFAQTYDNLGCALHRLGRLEEAAVRLREAVRLQPDFPDAYIHLGSVLRDLGRPDEATASLANALRLKPDHPDVQLQLGNVFKDQGRHAEAAAAYRTGLRLKPDAASLHSNLLLLLHYHPGSDPRAIHAEAQRWNQQHALPLRKLLQSPTNLPDPERRLRIGYVSPDFCEHPVSSFTIPLLAHHGHERFEIFCYANLVRPDAVTDRLRGHADVWRSTRGLSDEQVGELVRSDQIDILVDLAMHTAGNHLLVFAHKPAPVQVTWLAYPGTTGLSTIDYRLTDPYLDPPGLFDACYAEGSVRLADTFWCYDPLTESVPINPLPALAQGHVTFGCLNNFCKINDGVLALWAQILQEMPRARLLLLAPQGETRTQVEAQMERAGVAASRVEFADRQRRRAYFQQYQRLDVVLDPFPCNGGTTSLDGLWMGVPFVTLVGQTVVGRAGWSQLCNLGLQELAAQTPEQ